MDERTCLFPKERSDIASRGWLRDERGGRGQPGDCVIGGVLWGRACCSAGLLEARAASGYRMLRTLLVVARGRSRCSGSVCAAAGAYGWRRTGPWATGSSTCTFRGAPDCRLVTRAGASVAARHGVSHAPGGFEGTRDWSRAGQRRWWLGVICRVVTWGRLVRI